MLLFCTWGGWHDYASRLAGEGWAVYNLDKSAPGEATEAEWIEVDLTDAAAVRDAERAQVVDHAVVPARHQWQSLFSGGGIDHLEAEQGVVSTMDQIRNGNAIDHWKAVEVAVNRVCCHGSISKTGGHGLHHRAPGDRCREYDGFKLGHGSFQSGEADGVGIIPRQQHGA